MVSGWLAAQIKYFRISVQDIEHLSNKYDVTGKGRFFLIEYDFKLQYMYTCYG